MRKILLPPILLLVCLVGMIAFKSFGNPIIFLAGPMTHTGYIVGLIGIVLPVWGAQVFKRHQTNIIPYRDPDKIVTEGPFRFSRNPMYLGMLLILLGATLKQGMLEGFLFTGVFFSVANWWYIPFEEQKMRTAFGTTFDEYCIKVRRWL